MTRKWMVVGVAVLSLVFIGAWYYIAPYEVQSCSSNHYITC